MSSLHEEKTLAEAPKTRIPDIRNAELVSRLLAANPPYLYSALPLQPHAFFFSEMLRSFVQARNGCRAAPLHHQRRFKRRPHKYFASEEPTHEWPKRNCDSWAQKTEEKKDTDDRVSEKPDAPLELTVDKTIKHFEESMSPELDRAKSNSPTRRESFVDVGTEEILPKPSPCLAKTLSDPNMPSNLILPPPPPMWYPPLYNPPFGVDPLNFFIDLRVSGHIYDRKRALVDGLPSSDVTVGETDLQNLPRDISQKSRHVSAFSVPIRGQCNNIAKSTIEQGTVKGKPFGTSYVMNNLKNIYTNVADNNLVKETKAEASDVTDDEALHS